MTYQDFESQIVELNLLLLLNYQMNALLILSLLSRITALLFMDLLLTMASATSPLLFTLITTIRSSKMELTLINLPSKLLLNTRNLS